MNQPNRSQNPKSTSIWEKAQLKFIDNGFWLLKVVLLFCLLFVITPSFAENQLDDDFLAMYQEAFGNSENIASSQRISAPVVKTSPKTPKTSQAKLSVSPVAQNIDMSALYTQAFGKKKPRNKTIYNSESTEEESSNSGGKKNDLATLYEKAFGKKKISSPSTINVELRVNNIVQGDVTVFSNPQNEINQVATEPLLEILKDVLKEHIHKRVQQQIGQSKKTTFDTLDELGLKSVYNSVNLSLDMEIKPEIRKPQVLSMSSKAKVSVPDENKITASEISAFLNIYSNLELTSNQETDPDLRMRFEGSVNVGDVVLESDMDYRNDKIEFGRTTLTYDKPDKLKRFAVGHVSTGNRNFQENLELKGFRLSKEFFMDPELQIRPKADESFILATDSEIEVYINNQLQQRFYLKQGVYSLQDIGLYDGANDIRIKIKDEFGRITEKTSRQFYDSHLLKPELSLYAISVGVISNKEAYINDELSNQPIFSGYYQKGLSENLTMSLDAQISPDSYLLGAEAIASIEQGSIKQSFGISGGAEKDTGYAARIEFRPNIKRELIGLDTLREDSLELDSGIGQFLTGWTMSGEYRNKDFAMINEVSGINDDTKKLKARLQTQFGVVISNEWRGTLNLGLTDYYDAEKNISAGITANRRFNNGVSLSLGARYDSDDDFSVNMQISIPLSRESGRRKKDLDLLVNSKDNSYGSRLTVRPKGYLGKNSLSGSLEYQQNDSARQQLLDLNYNDSYYEAQILARNRTTSNDQAGSQQNMNIGFNTSLLCVGKECAVSRPVHDSFALVEGPINQEAPIALSNGNNRFKYSGDNESGLPDNYTALISKKGSKGVVSLDSYRHQRINIDETTLPAGYDTEKTEFEVFPRYHQGFHIKAGGEPGVIVDGMLVDESGKPMGYKGGQWTEPGENGKTIAFFSNKAGKFRISSIPPGQYKLELFDYPDMRPVNIQVPDKKGQVYDTGNLLIRQ